MDISRKLVPELEFSVKQEKKLFGWISDFGWFFKGW